MPLIRIRDDYIIHTDQIDYISHTGNGALVQMKDGITCYVVSEEVWKTLLSVCAISPDAAASDPTQKTT